MEGVTYVAVPGWALAALGVLFAAFIGWAIHDRVRIGETLSKIRERLASIEQHLRKRFNGRNK